jgi:hypothetical protein
MNRTYSGLDPPNSDGRGLGLTCAAAAAGVAKANVAAAAALAAAFQAIAAGLQHLAALGVAARAGDAATFLRVLALAVAAAQVDVADLDAVPGAAARAGAVAQGLTKALQRLARRGIVATAVQLETTLALLELQFTPRHHADVRRGGGGGCIGRKGRRRSGRKSTPTFHDSAGHKQHSFGEGPAAPITRLVGNARILTKRTNLVSSQRCTSRWPLP